MAKDIYVRGGITTSSVITALARQSWAHECFYRRMLHVVDDFGLADGRPDIVRVEAYPTLLDVVREAEVTRWIEDADLAGAILRYSINDRPFLWLLKTNKPRAKSPKFPVPPKEVIDRAIALAGPEVCAHLLAHARTCEHMRPIPIPIPNTNTKAPPAPPPNGDPVAEVLLVTGLAVYASPKVEGQLARIVLARGKETAIEAIQSAFREGKGGADAINWAADQVFATRRGRSKDNGSASSLKKGKWHS